MSEETLPEIQIKDKNLPIVTAKCIVQIDKFLLVPETKVVRILDGFTEGPAPLIKDEVIAARVRKVIGRSMLVYAVDAKTIYEFALLDKEAEIAGDMLTEDPNAELVKGVLVEEERDKFVVTKLDSEYETPAIGKGIATELVLEIKDACVIHILIGIVREGVKKGKGSNSLA